MIVVFVDRRPRNEPITSKTIYAIQDGAPLWWADRLQAGTKVLAVNGRRCFVANDILYELVRTQSYSADFTVLRDGKRCICRSDLLGAGEHQQPLRPGGHRDRHRSGGQLRLGGSG